MFQTFLGTRYRSRILIYMVVKKVLQQTYMDFLENVIFGTQNLHFSKIFIGTWAGTKNIKMIQE